MKRNVFGEEYFTTAYGGEYLRRNPQRKLGFYLERIREAKPGGRLLDIGCAYGSFISLATRYYDVSGCDVSEHAVAKARELHPGIDFFHSDIDSIVGRGGFDVITCFDVLEHVPGLDAAISKVRGMLNDGGILAVTVPVYDTIVGRLVGLLDRDETHIWKESRSFWRQKLRDSGFDILSDVGLWRYFLLNRWYVFFGGTLWRNFSPALLLIGGKR